MGRQIMEDDSTIPITVAPEDLFVDLREQTTVTLLSGGLLRYTDPNLAPVTPTSELDGDELSAAAD